jgi:glucosyl-3-phosphoglycerate synthase
VSTDAAISWLERRSFHHSRYDEAFIAARRQTVSVCLPARECAATIGPIVATLAAMRDRGAIDEVVVIDAASADATGQIAADAGATVYQEAELMAHHGPVAGKGDAMWRALSVLGGELICYLDADLPEFPAHFPVGLLGPLLEFEEVEFVKAYYRRPFQHGELVVADGGGRVSHLLARPALAIFYPALAAVHQPLAGEIAARRSLLERLPFMTGYGVEMAMLLDVLDAVGLDGMAQVDLDLRRNSHQPLLDLSAMSYCVLRVIAARLEREGRLLGLDPGALLLDGRDVSVPPLERPPMATAAAGVTARGRTR